MTITPSAYAEKYTLAALESARKRCDPLADAVAARTQRARPWQMVESALERAASGGQAEKRWLEQLQTVPAWVNWEAIEQGRRVSLAFANARALALLVSSLVEGYSLSKAAHVLIATGRLHQDVKRRLTETGQMSHNMHLKDAMRPGGKAHRTIAEVRLLHAMVRKYLREKGDWDAAYYGEPINQEDMAFTIIEFDYLAVRGMAAMGIELKREDQEALHHLWRYAAYLHGVEDFFLTESVEEEIAQYQAIRDHQRLPNEESRQLVEAVLDAVAHEPPFYFSKPFLYEMTRRALGDELASAYGIPVSPVQSLKMEALIRANRVATLAHYHLPGNRRLAEVFNFNLFRFNLNSQLPKEARKRAFRIVA